MGRENLTLILEGGRELQTLFAELPKRVVNRCLRRAVQVGSAPILKTAKAKAPRESGLMKRSLTRRMKSRKGAHTATIGARKGFSGTYRGRKRVPSRYLHLVSKGTKAHSVAGGKSKGLLRIRSKGYHPGAQANDFLAEAYRANKGNAERLAAASLRSSIYTEAKKLGKR
jgi:HK97 gp10 family phage protein